MAPAPGQLKNRDDRSDSLSHRRTLALLHPPGSAWARTRRRRCCCPRPSSTMTSARSAWPWAVVSTSSYSTKLTLISPRSARYDTATLPLLLFFLLVLYQLLLQLLLHHHLQLLQLLYLIPLHHLFLHFSFSCSPLPPGVPSNRRPGVQVLLLPV